MKKELVVYTFILSSITLVNYIFGKIFVVAQLDIIFLFLFIILSSICLLIIVGKYQITSSLRNKIYLLVSSINVFLLTTTVFTKEEVYLKTVVWLLLYWAIVSFISYYLANKITSKIVFKVGFAVYVALKISIPLYILFGIGMSSYGNV